MSDQNQDLGRLVSTFTASPAHLQRAAIITVLSFVFFLAMLAVFYVRRQIGYFVLSTAFLVVYIFTLIGWVLQRRNAVKIYERGLKYRKFAARWNDIEAVKADASGIEIKKNKREMAVIPSTILGFEEVARIVRDAVTGNKD